MGNMVKYGKGKIAGKNHWAFEKSAVARILFKVDW